MNTYFNSVFTTDDFIDLSSLHQSIHFYPKLIDTIKFTPENVCEELVNLQRDKACGPDSILAYLLKVVADFICLPLSNSPWTQAHYLGTGLLLKLFQFIKRVINTFPPTTVP